MRTRGGEHCARQSSGSGLRCSSIRCEHVLVSTVRSIQAEVDHSSLCQAFNSRKVFFSEEFTLMAFGNRLGRTSMASYMCGAGFRGWRVGGGGIREMGVEQWRSMKEKGNGTNGCWRGHKDDPMSQKRKKKFDRCLCWEGKTLMRLIRKQV